MTSFTARFCFLVIFAVVWFFGYETLRSRRARHYKGQSTQTCLMEVIYMSGWLFFIFAVVDSIVGEILKRSR